MLRHPDNYRDSMTKKQIMPESEIKIYLLENGSSETQVNFKISLILQKVIRKSVNNHKKSYEKVCLLTI